MTQQSPENDSPYSLSDLVRALAQQTHSPQAVALLFQRAELLLAPPNAFTRPLTNAEAYTLCRELHIHPPPFSRYAAPPSPPATLQEEANQ